MTDRDLRRLFFLISHYEQKKNTRHDYLGAEEWEGPFFCRIIKELLENLGRYCPNIDINSNHN